MYHFPSMNRANDRLSTDDLIGFAPFKKNLDPISSGWKLPITREEIVGGSFIRERERVKDISDGNTSVIHRN